MAFIQLLQLLFISKIELWGRVYVNLIYMYCTYRYVHSNKNNINYIKNNNNNSDNKTILYA